MLLPPIAPTGPLAPVDDGGCGESRSKSSIFDPLIDPTLDENQVRVIPRSLQAANGHYDFSHFDNKNTHTEEIR